MTTFDYDGKDYTLNLTRAGAREAERQGLTASDIGDKPFSALYLLFFAGLYSDYKVNPQKAEKMLDALLDEGKVEFSELFKELSEAYVELFGLGGSE